MLRKILAGALATGFLASAASAETCNSELLGSYYAMIGSQDLVSSAGARLRTVAAILQQDRANMHRFRRFDPQDDSDQLFQSAASRALIPRWLGPVDRATTAAILRGNVDVRVHVHECCIEVTRV